MRIDRRRLMWVSGALAAATSLRSAAFSLGRQPLILIDGSLTEREKLDGGVTPGAEARAIQPDIVRQWRDGLAREVATAAGAIAYVRWDKALLLADLAREARMTSRYNRVSRAVFAVEISKR